MDASAPPSLPLAPGEFRGTTAFRKNLPMVCPAQFSGQIEIREVPDFNGAPGRIRTSGPQIRSLVLCSTVTRATASSCCPKSADFNPAIGSALSAAH